MIATRKKRWASISVITVACLCASALHAAIIPRLKDGQSLTIVAIGTSLTQNGQWFSQTISWLNQEYPGKVTAHNEAIAASASKYTATYKSPDSGLDVQLGKALAHNPDAVFIEFAMNDAYAKYQISLNTSKTNLQSMIGQINQWGRDNARVVDIVVQATNCCADINGHAEASARSNLADYYQGYRDVAAVNPGVLLIDHYRNWVDLYNSQIDHAAWLSYMDGYGVHPNAAGTAQIILPEIKQTLLSQVPEAGTSVLLLTAVIALLAHCAWRRRQWIADRFFMRMPRRKTCYFADKPSGLRFISAVKKRRVRKRSAADATTCYQILALMFAACILTYSIDPARGADVTISVDGTKTMHVMRGGIGASVHAIEQPMPVVPGGDKQFGGIKSHGGSGWGGNPPAEDIAAWRQIEQHADWLGLDWCRVELEQRMYQPERERFDWDNPEMRILYRILDWCQRRHCDVFLTQMWSNVAWNAFPEFRDSVTGRIHSGPASVEDFAEGMATMVEYLVKTKKYSCIRWLCITNEPSYGFSWFQKPPNKPMSITPALSAVRKSLDKRGLNVQLSGPDVGTTVFDPAKVDYRQYVGAYDVHDYYHGFDWQDSDRKKGYCNGKFAAHVAKIKSFADWAHQQDKPLFLSEYGSFMGYSRFLTALRDAEMVIRDLSAGVDGFNRWSLINRGDLDGEWQLVQTWDRKNKKLRDKYLPYPDAYYFFGLLSRYTAKHSSVLDSNVAGGKIDSLPRVFAAALRSPKDNLTVMVVNDANQPWDTAIRLQGLGSKIRLYRYDVSRANEGRTDLSVESNAKYAVSKETPSFDDKLAPESLTIYSTYNLKHSDPGITAED